MNEQKEERYWTRFADTYDADGEYIVGKGILRKIEEELLKERSLGNAIELGCGTGYLTKAIAQNAERVVATDFSDKMVEVARVELRGLENVTVEKADCAKTSYAGESFGSAFLTNLVHAIDNPAQCLQESHRILRNEGALIVVDFTGYRLKIVKKMKLGFRYMSKWGIPPRGGKNNMSPDELVLLVQRAGFHVESIQLLEDEANAIYLKGKKI
jgi:ubiquinone/menaquinone biosynthesis C-methylase UbiE